MISITRAEAKLILSMLTVLEAFIKLNKRTRKFKLHLQEALE